MPQHFRGRAAAALLSLCLCVASACIDDSPADPGEMPGAIPVEIPLGASLPPLAYTLTLTYADQLPTNPRPETITGHLYLDVAASGQVTGVISAVDLGPVGLATLSGQVEGAEIVILDAAVNPEVNSSLELDQLRIALLDTDGDGAADGAEGQANGFWYRGVGDVPDYVMHTSVLTAGLDATATSASLYVPREDQTLLPYDAVSVYFGEPLREADVRDELRILANGTAITGELDLRVVSGLVTGATFQPDAFLGFGAELTVDLGDLEDPSGHALAASEARVSVIADPGLLTSNAGFESDFAGWIVLGQASTAGEFEGFAPAEGAAQAVAPEGSTLAAALDVPGDATELDLSVTLFADSWPRPPAPEREAVIALHTASGEPIEVFDAGDVTDLFQPCTTCAVYSHAVGPLRRTVDLTSLRGQRVFLIAKVAAISWFDPNGFGLLIDDIQLR